MRSITVFLFLVLGGCASTRIASTVTPDFTGDTYEKIVVVAHAKSFRVRQEWEHALAKSIAENGEVAVLCLTDIFPSPELPMSEEDVDAVRQKLDEEGCQATLDVMSMEAGTTETYTPPTYHTYTSGSSTGQYTTSPGWGNTYTTTGRTNSSSQSTTYQTGGYTTHKPWARYEARVSDRTSGRLVWFCEGDSKGNAYADFGDLRDSFSGKVCKALVTDGIVAPIATEAVSTSR